MNITIRTDASLQIGTGHVMRCLALAETLRRRGAGIDFICRELEGNLIGFIQAKGFKVHALSMEEKLDIASSKSERVLEYSHWLGATQQQDAKECNAILKEVRPDWLIVDHYALDESWQIMQKGVYQKLMVIDDLADRKHQCDFLLDQTYGRQSCDYQTLVPDDCQMLLGSEYALLRPEFAQWREYSLKRRENSEFKKLLITMGGVDKEDITGKVLDELRHCDLALDMEVIVVMGSMAPHLRAVQQQAKALPCKVDVKSSVSNMAEIMANADLAIGAAGATTWERCCLALPSLLVVLAENQRGIANILTEKRIAMVVDKDALGMGVCKIKNLSKQSLLGMSKKAAAIVDGLGVQRVSNIFYEAIL